MDPSIVEEGWKKLQDRFYRKVELYKMRWGDVSMLRSTVVAASCGGALGMTNNLLLFSYIPHYLF